VGLAQVVVDREGSGVHAELGQLLAQLNDLILDRIRRAVRDPVRGF
jgi:hypothetical protein